MQVKASMYYPEGGCSGDRVRGGCMIRGMDTVAYRGGGRYCDGSTHTYTHTHSQYAHIHTHTCKHTIRR